MIFCICATYHVLPALFFNKATDTYYFFIRGVSDAYCPQFDGARQELLNYRGDKKKGSEVKALKVIVGLIAAMLVIAMITIVTFRNNSGTKIDPHEVEINQKLIQQQKAILVMVTHAAYCQEEGKLPYGKLLGKDEHHDLINQRQRCRDRLSGLSYNVLFLDKEISMLLGEPFPRGRVNRDLDLEVVQKSCRSDGCDRLYASTSNGYKVVRLLPSGSNTNCVNLYFLPPFVIGFDETGSSRAAYVNGSAIYYICPGNHTLGIEFPEK